MATNPTPAPLGMVAYGTDICLPIQVEVTRSFWKIDYPWIGGAFALGFLLGLIIAIICAKICVKDIAKKKIQDEENAMMDATGIAPHQRHKLLTGEVDSGKHKKKLSGKRRSRKVKKTQEQDVGVPIVLVELGGDQDEETGTIVYGMVEALVMGNSEGVTAEILKQDLDSVLSLEKELREESIMGLLLIMKMLLNRLLSKGKITESQYKDLLTKEQDKVNEIIRQCQQEKDEAEEELRNNNKYKKDLAGLERELEKLHPQYVQRMNSLMKDEKERFRQELGKTTDLSPNEVEALMEELSAQSAALENKLAEESARQSAALEERLAKRRYLAMLAQLDQEQDKAEIHFKVDSCRAHLGDMVEDKKMTEKQRDELMNQYEKDLKRVQMVHEEEVQRQQLALAEKLRKNREARMKKLMAKQDQQTADFMKKADKGTDAAGFVEAYHDLLTVQRQERDALDDDLDQMETEEMARVRQEMTATRQDQLEKPDDELQQSAVTKGQLSRDDADRLMRMHQQAMAERERIQKSEKKRMQGALEEKLEQRRMKVEEENKRLVAEQMAMKEQQDQTVKKVLDSQIELDQEARRKIMQEYEQNMVTVNNQLQMSKTRQQKQLEQKLAARKARVAELKQQAEQARLEEGRGKDKLQKQLQKQIEEEEKKIEVDRAVRLEELRKRLQEETDAALKEQERQIGLLIARLEVGAARRQAIIAKQDKTIKELESQMAERVEEAPHDLAGNQADHLMQQHYNQVTQLNDQMQQAKERQEAQLQEKLEAKRIRKERDMENQLESEAQEEWEEQKKRGAGLATSILSQSMLEQRHKAAMAQLEKEMQVEMQRQREELNAEMEAELQKELADQKKSFLAQLAALSNLSKTDVNNIVENAVADTGGNEKQAKQLAKELRLEMKRTKTELGVGDDYDDRGRRPRRQYGRYDDDEDYYYDDDDDKPWRSKKKKYRNTHRDYDDY